MKKAFYLIPVVCLSASLCACSASANYSSTTTTTTTTTDADGNTTTTTETSSTNTYPKGSCAAEAADGQQHQVSVSIKNATSGDITGIYMCQSGAGSWSNLLEDDQYLGVGSTVDDFITITYTGDTLVYDMGIDIENGTTIEFKDIDISDLTTDGFTIEFGETDDEYTWRIDADYIAQ